MSKMIDRRVIRSSLRTVFIVLLFSVLQAGSARGAVLLREKFDGMGKDKPPQGGWQISGTGEDRRVIVSTGRFKDYSEDLTCRFGASPKNNVWLRSKSFGSTKIVWLDVWTFIDSDQKTTNGAILGPIDASNNFPCDLRLIGEGKGSGTYRAVVLSKDSRHTANVWKAVAMGLPVSKWSHWSFGVQITNADGDGFYWVLRNDKPLAVRQPFFGWSKVKTMNRVQFWGDAPDWYIDEITVTGAIPNLPAPTAAIADEPASPAFYQPKDLSRVAYGLAITPGGQLKISVGQTVFSVGSHFSRPGGGMLFLGPAEGEDKANRSWGMKVTKISDLEYVLEGSTDGYRLRRTIELLPNRVAVRDTLTNLTDNVQGVRFANEIRTPEFDRILVAGVPWTDAIDAINNPERPFVQIVKHNVALGLIARDDVYRNQSVDYAERGACGVRDDNLGLPPRGSITLKWELYPLASPDPFDFYNTVRAVWGTADARIPGLFAFVYPQRKWSKNGKTLKEMSVEEMRDWLSTNQIGYLCFVVQSETGGIIRDFGGEIEAFGSEYLTAKTAKAYWRPIVERLRAAKPDLKICPYFHMGADVVDESMKDCRVMLVGGRHKTFTNWRKISRGYYYPTLTNAFGRRIEQVFDMTLVDFKADTFYWDEYGDGNVSAYMENVPDWDNCSAIIDRNTNAAVKKITNVALVTAPMREKLTALAMAEGRMLWTNWQPTTEHDTALNIPHFLEHFYDGQYAARGYLASPIQLEGQTAASNEDVMKGAWKVLQAGLIYGHIGNSAFAETTESLLSHFYPITPTELHDGYIIGKERIITSRSGAFGFGDQAKVECFIYDASGRLTKDKGQTITRDNKTYQLVCLTAGQIAIVEKR